MAKKTKKDTKSKNKRSKSRWPALDKSLNLKSRSDLIDYDYLNQLSDKDKDFLNKFSEEFVGAKFDKNDRKNLHKTTEQKREIYNRNNARNRDVYTKSKMTGNLVHIEDMKILSEIVYNLDETSDKSDDNGSENN